MERGWGEVTKTHHLSLYSSMVEETKVQDTNTKTQLSLAAALFFSPLVQNMLNKNTRDISEQDRDFISGYIKFGYITILFGIITIVMWTMNYLFALNIFNIVYTISIFILIFLLIISVVSILSDIRLLRWKTTFANPSIIWGSKKDILIKYLPLYNLYLWYQSHTFDTPNWRIKESILLRTLVFCWSMTWNIPITTALFLMLILRIASLMSDIDFLNTPVKRKLNKLFTKNPEELRWYITGFIVYFAKSCIHLFSPMKPYTLHDEITKEKEVFSHILTLQNNTSIILEYILWLFLTVWFVYGTKLDMNIWTYYVWFLWLVARYILMILQLKHLPHLPIAREIMLCINKILSIFQKKSFTPNV